MTVEGGKMEKEINRLFRDYFGSEPASFFNDYFSERIPEAERLGTLNVMVAAMQYLTRNGFMPSKERMYSLIFDLCNYSYGEWWFAIRDIASPLRKKELASDSEFVDAVAKKVALKFTILVRGVREGKLKVSSLSPYSPVNTSLKALLVELINLNAPFALGNPKKSLVPDLFDKILRKAHGTLKMLSMGLGNEAYSSWRTLHEAECILLLLAQGGEPLENVYVKHMLFNDAFRGVIKDPNDLDRIFLELKSEMKAHGLKSKDMKKFIEYGWLYETKPYKDLVTESRLFNRLSTPVPTEPGEVQTYKLAYQPKPTAIDYADFQRFKKDLLTWDHDRLLDFKLNFRDGVEELAGLTQFSTWYETASEVTHSSPVFFYGNYQFFFDLSTVALYQLSIRVAKLFLNSNQVAFQNNPVTLSMVKSLLAMAEAMCQDQCSRFKILYDIDVVDTKVIPVLAIEKTGNYEKMEKGSTLPGPILEEKEK